ncbi:MAG: hypothetical protein JWR24_1220 [Actinoallomurus sp.]|nr:hypothetical protein [Actinoallomurus sp.]
MAVRGLPNHLKVGGGVHEHPEAGPYEGLVVGQRPFPHPEQAVTGTRRVLRRARPGVGHLQAELTGQVGEAHDGGGPRRVLAYVRQRLLPTSDGAAIASLTRVFVPYLVTSCRV